MCVSACVRSRRSSLFISVCVTMLVTICSFIALNPIIPYAESKASGNFETVLGALSEHRGAKKSKNQKYENARVAFTKLQQTGAFLPIYQQMCMIRMLHRTKEGKDNCSTFEYWSDAFFPAVYYDEHSQIKDDAVYPIGDIKKYTWLSLFQGLSYLLPQRYVFNIAHVMIPRTGYLSRGVVDSDGNGCLRKKEKEPCWCVFCLEMISDRSVDEEQTLWMSEDVNASLEDVEEKSADEIFKMWKNKYQEEIRQLDCLWIRFWCWEMLALSVILSAYYLVIILVMQNSGRYRELR